MSFINHRRSCIKIATDTYKYHETVSTESDTSSSKQGHSQSVSKERTTRYFTNIKVHSLEPIFNIISSFAITMAEITYKEMEENIKIN